MKIKLWPLSMGFFFTVVVFRTYILHLYNCCVLTSVGRAQHTSPYIVTSHHNLYNIIIVIIIRRPLFRIANRLRRLFDLSYCVRQRFKLYVG